MHRDCAFERWLKRSLLIIILENISFRNLQRPSLLSGGLPEVRVLAWLTYSFYWSWWVLYNHCGSYSIWLRRSRLLDLDHCPRHPFFRWHGHRKLVKVDLAWWLVKPHGRWFGSDFDVHNALVGVNEPLLYILRLYHLAILSWRLDVQLYSLSSYLLL